MKRNLIISVTVIILMLILGAYLKNQLTSGTSHIGFSAKYTKTLSPGCYKGDSLKFNGKYAVISKRGKGRVIITNGHSHHEIKLTDKLIKKVKNDAPSQLTQIGYEEGPKFIIHKNDIIRIKSDDSKFKILLIMR